eukprot:scaffold226176_cov33-Tisochrysis_lutea.AAC.3
MSAWASKNSSVCNLWHVVTKMNDSSRSRHTERSPKLEEPIKETTGPPTRAGGLQAPVVPGAPSMR